MKQLVLALIVAFGLLASGCSAVTDGDTLGNGTDGPITTIPPGRAEPDRSGPTGAPDSNEAAGGQPVDAAADEAAGRELVWTVIAVERDDVLNVRGDPDTASPIVATFDPWTTNVNVLPATETTPNGTWRLVATPSGTQGWVNGRFLVAQPTTLGPSDEDQLFERSVALVEWALGHSGNEDGGSMLADRALWVGGLGIYGDGVTGWNWFPAEDVDQAFDWDRERTFDLGLDFGNVECGADCNKSINEFMNFERIDDSTRYLLDDIPEANARGWHDGELWMAPESLHRIVIDTPTSDPQDTLDWQRIHLVFDWSGGDPELLLINTHGWTP